MNLKVNHEIIEFDGSTVYDLIENSNINRRPDMVAIVNKSVVLQKQWGLHRLKEADSVFFITPTEGG